MSGRLGLTLAIGTVIAAAIATVTAVLMRHGRGAAPGRALPGGILVSDVAQYDAMSRFLFGSFYRGVAKDVAASAPGGGRLLEVGSGPGLLSAVLARMGGFEVTGIDLDPDMVERAAINAARAIDAIERRPTFLVGDAASIPFADRSFDVVVSTFSLHHWADPAAGLAEIGRILAPGGKALIWDFRPGSGPHPFGPRHDHIPDPIEHASGSRLRVADVRPWRWPWRFSFAQRFELVPEADG
jgi:SAM-dependent methyltransferase